MANRANAFQLLKLHDRALKDFTQAVQLDIKYASAYCATRHRRSCAMALRSGDGRLHGCFGYRSRLLDGPARTREAKSLREADFRVAEEPPLEDFREKSPATANTTQTAHPVRESGVLETQTALPALRGSAAETQAPCPPSKPTMRLSFPKTKRQRLIIPLMKNRKTRTRRAPRLKRKIMS